MGPELGQGQGLRPARWLPLGANWPRTAEPLIPGLRGGPARQGTRVHKAKLEFANPTWFFLAFCTASQFRAFFFTPGFFCFSTSESCRVSLGLCRTSGLPNVSPLLTPHLSPRFFFPLPPPVFAEVPFGEGALLAAMSNPTLPLCSCSGPFLPP